MFLWDMFFWRGSPDATLVQRIGVWVLGVTFYGIGTCHPHACVRGWFASSERVGLLQSSLG
jgi:hypothetical protein